MKALIKVLACTASVLGVVLLACEAIKLLYNTYGRNYIEVMNDDEF